MAEKIKVTFLGTGSSIPTARRNHPATLLQYKDEMILFDCGEGTQRQFRKARINPCKITKLLISHWHGDHVLGIPGLLQTLSMNGYNKKLEVYGPKGTKQKMRSYLDLFLNGKAGFGLEVHEISVGSFFEGRDFYLESLLMDHGVPTNAYSFVVREKSRLDREKLAELKLPNSPLIGELTKGKIVEINGKKVDGRKLMYTESEKRISVIIDSRVCSNAVKISKKADLLVCEASFSAEEERIAKDHGHMTGVEAAKIAKKAGAKKLALNHLSQRYEMFPKKILSEARKVFKEIFIPDDLDRIEI